MNNSMKFGCYYNLFNNIFLNGSVGKEKFKFGSSMKLG